MSKNLPYILLAVFFISLLLIPVWSVSEEEEAADPCQESGIVVKNMTLKNLWYKKDDGACFLWRRNYMFTIHPEEKIGIYSDLTCETLYCGVEHTYTNYRTIDEDNNCRVRVLTACNLSDM
jgi:hypothetical protein